MKSLASLCTTASAFPTSRSASCWSSYRIGARPHDNTSLRSTRTYTLCPVFFRFGWAPVVEGNHIIGLSMDGQSISLEPGGQFELSGAPLETLHQTCAEVNNHLYQACMVLHYNVFEQLYTACMQL